MKVRIYTHTKTKKENGVCIYVIEAPEKPASENNPTTKAGRITETNKNEAEVTCLLRALQRLRGSSDVEIHTESGYVAAELAMIGTHRERGFKTLKGRRIRYAYIWEQIADILDRQSDFSVYTDTGNEWTEWMKEEAERKMTV